MKDLAKICILISIAFSGCESDSCVSFYNRAIKPMNFYGVLTERFYDTAHRGQPVLVVQGADKSYVFGPIAHDTTGGLWNNVKLGDTLIKRKGDYHFLVKENGIKRAYYFGTCGGFLIDSTYRVGKIIK